MRCIEHLCRRCKPAEHQRRADGNNENRKEHHHTLDEVRTRHRKEAADKRIEHDDTRSEQERRHIRQAENRLKEASRRYKS